MSKILQAYRKQESSGFPTESLRVEIRPVAWDDVFPRPAPAQEAEFSHLASTLLEHQADNGGTVVCFASTVAGEGTSFVSYHTARLLARDLNRKVAWVEANHLSPQARLAGHGGPSLAELLTDPEALGRIAPSGNLAVVPAGNGLGGLTDRVTGAAGQELLARLSRVFEFVILDCPPMLSAIETAHLAAAAHGFVAVVERKRMKWEIVQHALDGLKSKNVNIIGAVLNRRRFELPKFIYDRL